MIVDAEKIIQDTKDVFFRSDIQKKNFSKIKNFVNENDYKRIHKEFLTPLKIDIDVDLFLNEIEQYSEYFEKWGNDYAELPRYGLALVNQNGKLQLNDPINGSLYEWNNKNPEAPIIEIDCRVPTEAMFLESLKPIRIFDGHWTRSNILKWHESAEFKPHIDTLIPSPWLRLWATSNKDVVLEYYNDNEHAMVSVNNIIAGKLYLIDTSKVHYARSNHKNLYQLFLSVDPTAYELLEELLDV